MASSQPKGNSILFVCLGNICRSTMAEGTFRNVLSKSPPTTKSLISTIDSCGTGAYHQGSPPDSRTMQILQANGIKDYDHYARKLRPQDFKDFDWLMAMDTDNYDDLVAMRKRVLSTQGGREDGIGQVAMWGDRRWGGKTRRGTWSGDEKGEEIDDPYYGGSDGFKEVYSQVERLSRGFLDFLQMESEHGGKS